jgi:hypothetical protein
MTAHDHDDPGVLTFGCKGCLARLEAARIEGAPVRAVTWHCSYNAFGDNDNTASARTLQFTLNVKVPEHWGADRVESEYAGLTGEAFVMALPDDVSMDSTDYAVETMDVERITIGAIIDTTAPMEQPSLLYCEPSERVADQGGTHFDREHSNRWQLSPCLRG